MKENKMMGFIERMWHIGNTYKTVVIWKYCLGDLCIHGRIKLKYEDVYMRIWAASISYGARAMVVIWCDFSNASACFTLAWAFLFPGFR